MIKKTKHPKDRGERLALKVKKQKKVHPNASPVFKLLQERELQDAEHPNDRSLPEWQHP